MKPLDIEHITLTVRELCAGFTFDEEHIPPGNGHAYMRYMLEGQLRAITIMLKVPAKVLQDDRVVAEYPDGLWQHIRKSIGLKHRKVVLRANEWVTFPTVEIPPLEKPMRIYYSVGSRIEDCRMSDDE